MSFKIMDTVIIRPINKNGLVTSGNHTVWFIEFKEPDIFIITLDNPDQGRHFKINKCDILQIYDLLDNSLVYQYDVNRAL
jgi:hypothetical protein